MGLGVLTTSNCCTAKERKDILIQLSYEYDSSTECFYIISHVIPHSYNMPCWVLTTPYIVCWTGAMSSAACKNLTVLISHTLLTFTWINQNSYFSCISKLICPFAKFWNNSWPFEPFHLLGARFSAHKTQTH